MRTHYNEKALYSLVEDIKMNGNIEPIVIREIVNPETGEIDYELIVGERRKRAMELIPKDIIEVMVVQASDLEAAAAVLEENLQRENFSYPELVKGIALNGYNILRKVEGFSEFFPDEQEDPLVVFVQVLRLSERIQEKQDKGYDLAPQEANFAPVFGVVTKYFFELPAHNNLVSYLKNDLNLYLSLDEELRVLGMKHQLNRSQLVGLRLLKKEDLDAFLKIIESTEAAEKRYAEEGVIDAKNPRLREIPGSVFSGMANKVIQARSDNEEQARVDSRQGLSQAELGQLYSRLGWESSRSIAKLGVTPEKFPALILDKGSFDDIQQKKQNGKSLEDLWKETVYPFILLWLVFLDEAETDLQRFSYLKWKMLSSKLWSNKVVDSRFMTGESLVSMEVVARLCLLLVEQEQRVLNLIADNSLLPQTCLLMKRKCLSFSPDPDNTNPFLLTFPQEVGAMAWPLEEGETVDWVFCYPPLSWLQKAEDVSGIVEELIRTVIDSSPCKNLVFVIQPPLQMNSVSEQLFQLGWKLTWDIHFPSSIPKQGKEESAQLLGDKRIKPSSIDVLVMKKAS